MGAVLQFPGMRRGKTRAMTRILVVDDDDACRRVVSAMLSSEGYAVESAGNGMSAVERIATERWDLVVSDISMPGIDGCRVISEAHCRGIRAIGMSGSNHSVAMPDGVPFLEKPFRYTDLAEAVSQALA